MFTTFDREDDSKALYFKLNSSFQIVSTENQSSTFKFAGLYAIFKDDICYYVGQSQNLASRISQHLTGKYESCDKVILYLAKSNGYDDFDGRSKEARRSILELNEFHLMKILKPIENLITPPQELKEDQELTFTSIFNNQDILIDCDITVFSENISISICGGSQPDFYGLKCMSDHNEMIVDYIVEHGPDFVKGEFCNG